jgi:hypothetical protein
LLIAGTATGVTRRRQRNTKTNLEALRAQLADSTSSVSVVAAPLTSPSLHPQAERGIGL